MAVGASLSFVLFAVLDGWLRMHQPATFLKIINPASHWLAREAALPHHRSLQIQRERSLSDQHTLQY